MTCLDVMTKIITKYISTNFGEEEKLDVIVDFSSFSDWDKFLLKTRTHCCTGMIYAGIRTGAFSGIPEKILNALKFHMFKSLERMTAMEKEAEYFSNVLSNNKIDHMFFKGHVVKSYYPDPEFREMGDIDVTVRNISPDDLVRLLSDNGFEYKSRYYGVYTFARNSVNFEVHYTSFDVHKLEKTNFAEYMDFSWENSSETEKQHLYKIDPSYHFVYLLCHLYKHFLYSGVGIRYFIDFPLFIEAEKENLDVARINELVRKMKLEKIVSVAEYISREWLGKDVWGELAIERLCLDEETDACLKKYIYQSELHGGNKAMVRAQGLAKDESSFKHLLRLTFPPAELMRFKYPYVGKCKLLLPVAWIARFFRVVFVRKISIKEDIIIYSNDKIIQMSNDINMLFEKLGIEK